MGERRYANRPWNLLVNVLAASSFLTARTRERLYRRGGIRLNGTAIRPGVWFFSDNIAFGNDGIVEREARFENRERVTIGHRCYIGPQVYVGTSTHALGGPVLRAGEYAGAAVTIGDGCWIGARAMILPGVTIAESCVIAAGSVVIGDTEPNGLYAGVPALRKKTLPS